MARNLTDLCDRKSKAYQEHGFKASPPASAISAMSLNLLKTGRIYCNQSFAEILVCTIGRLGFGRWEPVGTENKASFSASHTNKNKGKQLQQNYC